MTIAEMDTNLGGYFDVDDTWRVIGEAYRALRIVREDGTLIAILKRDMIEPGLVDVAVKSYLAVGKMVSSNRGHAAGLKTRNKTHDSFEKGAESNSGIMGYIDNTSLSRPCRMTQFTKRHFQQYTAGLPFIKRIDHCFRELLPDVHARQLEAACKTQYRIEDTAFSTVTVNYNFRTALHKDSGDFRQGFGNLVVCQKNVTGGLVLFPRYKLAIELRNGDFLAMDVHEYHCNSPIVKQDANENAYRLSFVCYLRDRMVHCDKNNAVIKSMGGGTKKSADWIKDIFGFYGEDVPNKEVTGVGPAGHEWWVLNGGRVSIIYKNKRYTLIDTIHNITVHELGRAWTHAHTHFMQQRSQSQEVRDSYQAQ